MRSTFSRVQLIFRRPKVRVVLSKAEQANRLGAGVVKGRAHIEQVVCGDMVLGRAKKVSTLRVQLIFLLRLC